MRITITREPAARSLLGRLPRGPVVLMAVLLALAAVRFAGDPTAIFHRSADGWRPVLDAVSYSCPVRALPGVVQSELDVCPAHQGLQNNSQGLPDRLPRA